jgi:hypothetical protein
MKITYDDWLRLAAALMGLAMLITAIIRGCL